jgi:microcystin-dependent protein
LLELAPPNPDADGLVGAITPYAGETLPGPKYRWCHGTQTLSRTEFSLLFARLGESWGVGDGSTTFNLPNLNKLVLVGMDSTGADTDFDAVGNTGGSKAATMPSHGHTISPSSHSHTHQEATGALGAQAGGSFNALVDEATTATSSVSLTVDAAGGSGDNMPPFATVRYLIKVA